MGGTDLNNLGTTNTPNGGPNISRRTLAKGAAWAVPAVAAAVAAPVYACSVNSMPQSPEGVTLTKNPNCRAVVGWTVESGKSYEIEYTTVGGATGTVGNFSTSPQTLTGAPTDITSIRIRVYNPACYGHWSEQVPFVPAAPRNVTQERERYWFLGWIYTNNVNVSWDAPTQGTVAEYEVKAVSANITRGPITKTANQRAHRFTDLNYSMVPWTVMVRAKICGVWSQWLTDAGDLQRMGIQQGDGAEPVADGANPVSEQSVKTQAADQGSMQNSKAPSQTNTGAGDVPSTAGKPSEPAKTPSARPSASQTPSTKPSASPTAAAPEPPVAPTADPAPAVEVVSEG